MHKRKQVKTIRFCLIGVGRAGSIHAHNLSGRIPSATLGALCDVHEEAVQEAGRELGVSTLYYDYREAVSDPDIDAVVIVTPTFLHAEIACEAVAHGKHVFLEKPMARTVAECEAINGAVAQAGIQLQIGFMRRFDPGYLQAKEIIDSGELGRVVLVKSTGRGPGGPGPWMYDLKKSNGILAEVNSHDIDSILWFTESQVEQVYAQGSNFRCPDARESYPDFYDSVVAQFGFADGSMGVVDGACPAHYGYDARVEILCERGVLFIGYTQQPGLTKVTVDGQVGGQAVQSWRTLFKDAYVAEMQHFVDCILSGQSPRVSGLDGLKAVELVVAANRSIQTKTSINLQDVER